MNHLSPTIQRPIPVIIVQPGQVYAQIRKANQLLKEDHFMKYSKVNIFLQLKQPLMIRSYSIAASVVSALTDCDLEYDWDFSLAKPLTITGLRMQ